MNDENEIIDQLEDLEKSVMNLWDEVERVKQNAFLNSQYEQLFNDLTQKVDNLATLIMELNDLKRCHFEKELIFPKPIKPLPRPAPVKEFPLLVSRTPSFIDDYPEFVVIFIAIIMLFFLIAFVSYIIGPIIELFRRPC